MMTTTTFDENLEDAILYARLCKERSDGLVKLAPQEKADFEKWLGIQTLALK